MNQINRYIKKVIHYYYYIFLYNSIYNNIRFIINGTILHISDLDCYMLVSKGEAIWLTTNDTSAKLTTMRTITDDSLSS